MSANISTSEIQHEMILAFMENHTLFARKQITKLGLCGVDKYRQMWSNLALELNDIGPAKKTVDQWETFWNDVRLNAKNCMQDFIYESRQTGNHNVELPHPFVQRVCSLYGPFGVGIPVIPELGVYNSNLFCDQNNQDESGILTLWDDQCQTQNEIEAARLEKYTMETILTTSDFKENMPSTSSFNDVKLSSDQLKYIAAFYEGKEEGMTARDWENLAKKPMLIGLGRSGEWVKAAWEIEVEKALNKQFKISNRPSGTKLTTCEKAMIQAVTTEKLDTVEYETDNENYAKEPEEDSYQTMPFFNQTQAPRTKKGKKPMIASQFSPSLSDSEEPEPLPRVCTSAKALLDKYTAAQNIGFSYPVQCSTKRQSPDIAPPIPPKKSKMTGLKAQIEGLGTLQEGNQIVAALVDLLIESFHSHTAALQGLTAVVRDGFTGLKEHLNELSEQITLAFIKQGSCNEKNEVTGYKSDDSNETDARILEFIREAQERERYNGMLEAGEKIESEGNDIENQDDNY